MMARKRSAKLNGDTGSSSVSHLPRVRDADWSDAG